jgi:chemotaxis protein histidine kinase CheA
MFDRLTDARALVATAFEDSFSQQICVNELEEAVRELRLIPLGTLFESYRRAVRDMAKEQGKRARIDISGGEVEVDKQVFDEMSETLLHLIRNSVDHGIEPPDLRRGQGKHEEGTILLSARQYGAVVELKIQDDGKGLDPELIRQVAVSRKELTSREADSLDHAGIVDLIFRSGFSTKPQATDISGRGVGLNVVKQRIESMGGTLKVQSELQQGTTFVLTVPVSVTLTRAVMVECSGRRYAIHSESVLLVTEVDEVAIQKTGKQQMIFVDDEPVALEDLCLLLGGAPAMMPAEGSTVVMVLRYGRSCSRRSIPFLRV